MALVTVQQGTLRGNLTKTENGSEYLEFLEIPYAKPPVGELRFKSPQPPETWVGERDAISATKKRSQFDILQQQFAGTEDCLYLNVFTPNVNLSNEKLLPVMVFIHGGGFVFGNGIIKEEAGPDFFLEKGHDVVLVSINYRLNVFGFLSLDIPDAAGNMGLKDQVMALKWIQNNIAQFGGDKTNVTVFGISAGGASVEYLMLSPQANGLFHKAIIQSGSPLNHWANNQDPKLSAYKLAQELGFEGLITDYLGIYNYILKQSTDSIQRSFYKILPSFTDLRLNFEFVPCVEKDFGNGEAFLTEKPYNLLKDGKINKVIVIRGFCDTEGLLTKAMKPNALKELQENNNFIQHWPYHIDESGENYNQQLKAVYINNEDTKKENDVYVDFFTDFDFVSGIWIAAKYMAQYNIPVFMYEFSYGKEDSFVHYMLGYKAKGCAHGDDTAYILKTPMLEVKSEMEKTVRDRFVKMWTNFAKSENPIPQTDSLLPIEWPIFCNEKMNYLNINEELTLKSNYQSEKMAIFEDIYKKYEM